MVPERIAILVTGMHRTGTSAIARTLSLLGARLPTDIVPANEGNPHGHWEPSAIVGLNDRMLADAGSDLYSTIDFDPAWFETPRASSFVDEAAEVIRTAYEGDPFVVVKDPRVVLMLPIWDRALAELGYRVVHIVPLRHPQDVAGSLRRRHLKTISYDAWARPRGELVWLRYMLAAVRGSRGRQRSFVTYAHFLEDWRGEMRRVAAETGLIWPRLGPADRDIDDFLHANTLADRSTAHESRGNGDLDFCDLAGELYAILAARGDDAAAVDGLHADYARRTAGARDLIRTLEDLYPLIWAYYTDSRDLRRSLDLGQQTEGSLHNALQLLWSDLTRTTDEKGVLRQDLTAIARRTAGLDKALAEVSQERDELRSTRDVVEQHSLNLQTMVDQLGAEVQSLVEDRDAVRRDLEEHNAGLDQQIAELDAINADLRSHMRVPLPRAVTKSLRALARVVRR